MEQETDYKFFEEVKNRFIKPWDQSAFIGYFILSIILSCIAIMVPLVDISDRFSQAISSSMGTFFIASIVSSTIDLNLSFRTRNKASFSIYTILTLIVSIILFAFIFFLNEAWRLIPAIIGFLIALFVWIIANSEKDILNDEKVIEKTRESFATINSYDEKMLIKKIEDNE